VLPDLTWPGSQVCRPTLLFSRYVSFFHLFDDVPPFFEALPLGVNLSCPKDLVERPPPPYPSHRWATLLAFHGCFFPLFFLRFFFFPFPPRLLFVPFPTSDGRSLTSNVFPPSGWNSAFPFRASPTFFVYICAGVMPQVALLFSMFFLG